MTTGDQQRKRAQHLNLQQVSVTYGKCEAVKSLNIMVEQGEIACLLGPSGCGKSSLLRAIAGFEPLSNGEIHLKGKRISTLGNTLAPERRHIGMVFQDFALFPHLSAANNIAFGLRKLSKGEKQRRVNELLELVALPDCGSAFPHELSGGQQQRIALARAIAPEPDILLLDEPFSSLDVTLREELAVDVREVIKNTGITAVLVTHDQGEAFAVADKIAVMKDGCLLQWGSAFELYHTPVSPWVATFIGKGTLLSAQLDNSGQLQCALGPVGEKQSWSPGKSYKLLVRPTNLCYDEQSPLQLTITAKAFRGAEYYYSLAVEGAEDILCITPSHINKAIGQPLAVSVNLSKPIVFAD